MAQRDVILVIGQTGCGKTTFANNLISTQPRVLVADAGFQDYHSARSMESFEQLVEHLESKSAFGSLRPFRAAYTFKPNEYPLVFETAGHLKNLLLVLEEGDRFSLDDPGYVDTIFRGRHDGISLLLVSLHPRAIPTEVRRQATRIIAFKQVFPDDIKWLAEVVGEEAFKLPTLGGPPDTPPHAYLEWTSSGGAKIVTPKGVKVVGAPAGGRPPAPGASQRQAVAASPVVDKVDVTTTGKISLDKDSTVC